MPHPEGLSQPHTLDHHSDTPPAIDLTDIKSGLIELFKQFPKNHPDIAATYCGIDAIQTAAYGDVTAIRVFVDVTTDETNGAHAKRVLIETLKPVFDRYGMVLTETLARKDESDITHREFEITFTKS